MERSTMWSAFPRSDSYSLFGCTLEGSTRSFVQFEVVPPEAAPCVAYAPVDLDGQVGIVVYVPPELYELVCLVVHLVR